MKAMKQKTALNKSSFAMALAFATLVYSAGVTCPAAAKNGCTGQLTNRQQSRKGCCCVKYWDYYPTPWLNPPDDIATLPDLEQRKFVKAFEYISKEVKETSAQDYQSRMAFKNRKSYADLRGKLSAKLARDRKLAADPAITAEYVLKMCDEMITYGRSLVMGRIDACTLVDLARRYGFKDAAKIIDDLEDSRNFRHGLEEGFPHDKPECRDFETLAKRVNSAQWAAFLQRIETLRAKHDVGRGVVFVTKKEVYDQYDVASRHPLPADFATLPNKIRACYDKIYRELPPQAFSIAGLEYRERLRNMNGPKGKKMTDKLSQHVAQAKRRLGADPAVTPKEVMTTYYELVRYGRPLVCGEMRHVSLRELASTCRFPNVEKFLDEFENVERGKSVKRGFARTYPSKDPEFRDFATLAGKVKKDSWNDFIVRLAELNRLAGPSRRR